MSELFTGMPRQPNLVAGENAVVEVHRSMSGGCKIGIKDAAHPNGYFATVPPQTAVALALAILEAAGVPIRAEIGRRLIEGGGLPG